MKLLDAIRTASCITLDDSPYLHGWDLDDDARAVYFSWTDGEGLTFSVEFDYDTLENEPVADGFAHAEPVDDDSRVMFRLFTLVPVN